MRILLRTVRGIRPYHVKSRKGYTKVGKQKRRNIYAKILVAPSIKLPSMPTIEPTPFLTENTKAMVISRVKDYGAKPYNKIDFDIEVTKVFKSSETSEMTQWENGMKEFIKDKVLSTDRMNMGLAELCDGVIGFDRNPTDLPVGSMTRKFRYSHNGGLTWTSF